MASKMGGSEEQGTPEAERLIQGKRSDSPEPSCVSMKSDQSKEEIIYFRDDYGPAEFRLIQGKRSDSPEPSCVSMKSDQSKEEIIYFRDDYGPAEFRLQTMKSEPTRGNMESMFKELEHRVISVVQNQLKSFVKLLGLDYPACSERAVECEEDQSSVREGALKITLQVLRNMNQTDLANALQTKEELDEFDLSKFDPSEECLLRLLPVAKASRKVVLECCSITERGCAALVSAVKSNPSHLRELNLNSNKPGECGVKLLSDLLEDPRCKLEKLQLYSCSITNEGCTNLVSALKSNPSHLTELNLHYNKPGESGVKLLSDLLDDPQCKLEKLQLSDCVITAPGCAALISALKSNPSHLRELNLSWNEPGETEVKLLSDLLKDPFCTLENLQLCGCHLTEKSCAVLSSALTSNSSRLRELNLSHNELQDSGLELLSAELENPNCALENLELRGCKLTEKSCAVLCSALISNSSSLRELNLSENKLQDSGVKHLSAGLMNSHCKLEKLELSNCSVTEEGCAALVSALKSNPSHLRELNLDLNKPGDSGVKMLSDLLEDPDYRLENLHI
ncbi:hypothetical protein AOLI_G00104490 [Acnodon oligacanthus]